LVLIVDKDTTGLVIFTDWLVKNAMTCILSGAWMSW